MIINCFKTILKLLYNRCFHFVLLNSVINILLLQLNWNLHYHDYATGNNDRACILLSSHDGSTGGLDVERIIGTAKNDLTGPERGLVGVGDDVGHGGGARTESSAYRSARIRVLQPYEWMWRQVNGVSVSAMPTHSSRRDPELLGSLVSCVCVHARVRACPSVRRNCEHEDRWLIYTRFTYARASCYSFVRRKRRATDIEIILEINFRYAIHQTVGMMFLYFDSE